MIFLELWAYQTFVKNATNFKPFQLVHGVEVVLSIECKIPSIKITIELLPDTSILEDHLVQIEYLDEQHRDATMVNVSNKKHVKA